MISTIIQIFKTDPRARYILLAGFLVQLLFSITSTGAYHTDQHFQIIEFAAWKLGEPSGVTYVWEFTNHVRPTIQIWLFMGWHKAFNFLGPFLELTLLRL